MQIQLILNSVPICLICCRVTFIWLYPMNESNMFRATHNLVTQMYISDACMDIYILTIYVHWAWLWFECITQIRPNPPCVFDSAWDSSEASDGAWVHKVGETLAHLPLSKTHLSTRGLVPAHPLAEAQHHGLSPHPVPGRAHEDNYWLFTFSASGDGVEDRPLGCVKSALAAK